METQQEQLSYYNIKILLSIENQYISKICKREAAGCRRGRETRKTIGLIDD